MRALELKIPPLLLTAIFIGALFAVSYGVPAASFPFPYHSIAGAAFVAAGIAMVLGAALQFRMLQTTLDPRNPGKASRFVARGFYRISRNPMYLGMALVLIGCACWLANVLAYTLVFIFCVYLTEFQIKPEERSLQEKFGEKYLSYKARVRRWI